ncbi:13510_t:CDS:10 [Ambispora gerdemannii]|uniref:protein-serine/threonine phosphatase n=1 Tax=Ambispora gerdemannii TaxID=144530 RepID=A0A9N9GF10_9GLOM|nr:13510_t:CDS:10 [Ambispora gerdemannii]
MGQTLSEPIKEKHSSSDKDGRLMYAASAMQGWRISMEDAHTTILELDNHKGHSFFAVYDGHGGQNVAKYSGNHLHDRIVGNEEFAKKNYHEAIKNGFLGTDDDLRKDPQYTNDPSGCTAVTALVTPDNRIIVGNAGDSRAVISIGGVADPMSEDHKPVNKEETARILKAGGFVEFGRVNGNLALSRAIGDFEFKQNENLSPEEQIVTAMPETKERHLDQDTEFLVIACDGIWDCLTSQDVVGFIRREISLGHDLKVACENLMERCLARDSELGGIGCDNMTVIIVAFLNGKTEKEWYDWIKQQVQQGVGPALEEEKATNAVSESLDLSMEMDEEDLELSHDTTDDLSIGLDDNDAPQQNASNTDIPGTQSRRHNRTSSGSNSHSSSRSSSNDSSLSADFKTNVKDVDKKITSQQKNNNTSTSPTSSSPLSVKVATNNSDNNGE